LTLAGSGKGIIKIEKKGTEGTRGVPGVQWEWRGAEKNQQRGPRKLRGLVGRGAEWGGFVTGITNGGFGGNCQKFQGGGGFPEKGLGNHVR